MSEMSNEDVRTYIAALSCSGVYVCPDRDRAISKEEAARELIAHITALTAERDALKAEAERAHKALSNSNVPLQHPAGRALALDERVLLALETAADGRESEEALAGDYYQQGRLLAEQNAALTAHNERMREALKQCEEQEESCAEMRGHYARDSYHWGFWEHARKSASVCVQAVRAALGEQG